MGSFIFRCISIVVFIAFNCLTVCGSVKSFSLDERTDTILSEQLDSLKTVEIIAQILNRDISHPEDDDELIQFIEIARNSGRINELSLEIDKKGVRLRNSGEYDKSIRYHQLALKLAAETENGNLMARCNNNIGVVYRRLDDYQNAIDYHLQSLVLYEEEGNEAGVAMALNGLGNIDYILGDLDKALDYFTRALAIAERTGNMLGTAINLNNIGNIYKAKRDYQKALNYYRRSFII
jgi:tetratricopeptide (TPR) repeat protein